jgi:hypothetical protein
MKGFKGFNKDLKCTPKTGVEFQYEIGKTYTHDGNPSLCSKGFHFCENPLDVLRYYPPAPGGRYAEVEADGVTDERRDDSKRVAKSISVSAEMSLSALLGAGIKFVFSKVDFDNAQEKASGDGGTAAASGYGGTAAASGPRGTAAASGPRGTAAASGDGGTAAASGDESCAIATGIEGRAKGAIGCWITLSEWQYKDGAWHRIDMQTKKVDGVEIKADTFYALKAGKFEEVA